MDELNSKKEEILSEIHSLGYDSLRYSVFTNDRLKEWEVRIEFNPDTEEYEVYSTMDRASVIGKYQFSDYNEAKEMFFTILDIVVTSNRRSVERGEHPEYPSPLWGSKP